MAKAKKATEAPVLTPAMRNAVANLVASLVRERETADVKSPPLTLTLDSIPQSSLPSAPPTLSSLAHQIDYLESLFSVLGARTEDSASRLGRILPQSRPEKAEHGCLLEYCTTKLAVLTDWTTFLITQQSAINEGLGIIDTKEGEVAGPSPSKTVGAGQSAFVRGK